MEGIRIISASPNDRDWAAELMAASEPWTTLGVSRERCRIACHDPEFQLFIARRKDRREGFMIIDPRGVAGAPYIKSICVGEPFRNQKVGEIMMAYAEELYRPISRHLFLCVSSFNAMALSFYQRMGFQQVGEFKNFIIEGKSELLMHKRIS